jgi:hypothetical protein
VTGSAVIDGQLRFITHAEAGMLIYDHEIEPTARAIARLVGPISR